MLTIELNVPEKFQRRAQFALRELALRWGIPFRFGKGESGQPHLRYSESGQDRKSEGLWIGFDASLYAPATLMRFDESARRWSAATRMRPWDPVGASYRLLQLLDEGTVNEKGRDKKGRFFTAELAADRRKTVGYPLVDWHAADVLKDILKKWPHLEAERRPLWPSGKKWAFILTHDTDTLDFRNAREMFYNGVKTIFKQDRHAASQFFDAFKDRQADFSALYGFPAWEKLESRYGVKSCFYLFSLAKGARRDVNDCRSHILNSKVDWPALTAMVDRGWEFGVHAPIFAKEDVTLLAEAKREVEDRLGRKIAGLRHHYWALDWRAPFQTFRKHEAVGFRYDMSLAWMETTGYRAATSLPFSPFDPVRDREMSLYQLPTGMMDGHILGSRSEKESVQAGAEFLQGVKREGGAATLDWHTEAICDKYRYAGHTAVLEILLESFLDGDTWVATPSEVIAHWEARAKRLESRPAVETPLPRRETPSERPPAAPLS